MLEKLVATLCAVITACSASDSHQSSVLMADKIAVTPGEGYDTLRLDFTDHRCINFTLEDRAGLSERTGFIRRIDDTQEMARSLGFETNGSFMFGLAKGDAKAKLIQEGKSSERSIGFVAYTKVITRVARAMEPQLGDYSRNNCGDHYVSNVQYGAEMSVLVKMTFASQKFMRRFQASGSASYGSIGEIKASMESLDSETKKYSSISIEYAASGESLSHVQQIFDGRDAITCSLENFASCENVLARIIDYQNGPFVANAGASQTVIGLDLSGYPNTPIHEEPEILAKRQALFERLENTEFDQLRAKTLEASSLLNRNELEHVLALRPAISHNLSVLKEAIIRCFDDPEQCQTVPELTSYDRNILKHREILRDIVVTVSTSGVSDCGSIVNKARYDRCSAEAASLPADVDRIEVSGGHYESTSKDSIFSGRKCTAKYVDSICHVWLRL